MNHPSRRPAHEPADPRLEAVLRHAIAIGVVLVLLLPAARGTHAMLGWLPLWLLAMPLVAWWALHRFALPRWIRLAPDARATGGRRAGIATARPMATSNRYRRPQRRKVPLSPAPSGSRASG